MSASFMRMPSDLDSDRRIGGTDSETSDGRMNVLTNWLLDLPNGDRGIRLSSAAQVPQQMNRKSRLRHPDGRVPGHFNEPAVERENCLAVGGSAKVQRIGEVHTLLCTSKRLSEQGWTLDRNSR